VLSVLCPVAVQADGGARGYGFPRAVPVRKAGGDGMRTGIRASAPRGPPQHGPTTQKGPRAGSHGLNPSLRPGSIKPEAVVKSPAAAGIRMMPALVLSSSSYHPRPPHFPSPLMTRQFPAENSLEWGPGSAS
jgi:hypothetical protein